MRIFDFKRHVQNFERAIVQAAQNVDIDWYVSDNAPSEFYQVKSCVNEGLLQIFSGGCESTIFSNPRYNYLFRLLHDVSHVRYSCDFTVQGEKRLADIQAYAFNCEYIKALVQCEIAGQVDYFLQFGKFVEDQRSFAADCLSSKGWCVSNV